MDGHQVYSVTIVACNRAGSSNSIPGLIISELADPFTPAFILTTDECTFGTFKN